MYQRHNEVPIYATRDSRVEADQYNHVASALHQHKELRLPLPGLRNLALILQRDAWVVVDASLEDLPVLAWCDFQHVRSQLHQPVPCRLRYYHAHAGMLLKRVLEAMVLLLDERKTLPEGGARVVPFKATHE